MYKVRFVCLALALFSTLLLNAQGQNFTAGPQCPASVQPEYVKHLQVSTTLAPIVIGVPAGLGTISWEYAVGNVACGGAFSAQANGSTTDIGGNIRLTFNSGSTAATKNVTIGAAGPTTLTEGEFAFTLRLTSGGITRVKPFRLIVRKPLDMVFVLDRSGSMECDVDEMTSGPSWPGCATSNTALAPDNRRWDALKESVENFIKKLDNNHVISGDQFSEIYFAGGIMLGTITNDLAEFKPINDFISPLDGSGHTPFYQEMSNPPIHQAADPRLARDGTSLGEGMYKAIHDRFNHAENAGRRQVVLLFTDGEQNSGKFFKESGADAGRIIQTSASDATVQMNLNDAAIDGIQIFTVGVLETGGSAAELLLQKIADNHTPASNPNYFSVLPGAAGDFASEIDGKAFNEIYNATSPQFIRFDKHVFSYNATAESKYVCNKNVNRMIFEAHFDAPLARNAKLIIEKDGVDVSSQAIVHQGNYITTMIFKLYDLPELPSEGVWTVKLSNQDQSFNKNNVTLFATADDHHVEFNGFLEDGTVHVGQKLQPRIRLSAGGKPVTDAVAKAVIMKPGEDLGNLLSLTQTPAMPPKTSESGTCASQKLAYLQTSDPAILSKWKNIRSKEIILKHSGNGLYEGVYDETDVTGNYKIIYTISGNDPELGRIERLKDQTIHVQFAPVNINLDKRSVKSSKDGNYYFYLGMKPSYPTRGGKKSYLGPGYENAISVEGVKFIQTDDNCDGSYTLSFSSPQRDPRISVWVSDDKIYTGPASAFDDPYLRYRKNVSVHAGVATPFGDLDSLYDAGGFVEIDFGYSLNNRFALEAVGGYYVFKSDYNILGAALFLKYNLPLLSGGTGGLFLAAGPGVYKAKDEDVSFGYSAKAGFQKYFSEHLSASLELAGVFPKSKLAFGTIGLGLQYHF